MVNNCLVTKLKGTVDNPNLPILGALYIEHNVVSDVAQAFTIFGNNGDSVIVDSDEITEVFDYRNNPHALPYTVEFSAGSNYSQQVKVKQKGKLYIKSKYNINGIKIDLGDSNYIKLSGDIKDVGGGYKINPASNNYYLSIVNQKFIEGDISSIINEDSINNLINLNIQDTQIEGTATDLGKFINATELTVLRSGIRGSIEDIVNSQIAGGVSTRNLENAIYSNAVLYQLTFNGTYISTEYPDFHIAQGWITWESASKIAVYTGGDKTTYTSVACKGYTQAEAETNWPGKIIARVDA